MAFYHVNVGDKMGELLLCNEPIAAMPYYIENASLNIYTIEELCYYIKINTYMLDKGFVTEDLCSWLEKQIEMPLLANKLRQIIVNSGPLYELIFEIIKSTGYFTLQEMQSIVLSIKQMEEKSDFECKKLRADKILEDGKFLNSIYEYKRLLESSDANKESEVLIGNIWHNLGTAYARMFIFLEAAHCFINAYKLNGDIESLKECIMSYICAHEDALVSKTKAENNVTDIEMTEIKNEISNCILEVNEEDFSLDIANDKILEWKEEYRKHAFF